jgi:hypothetical protein
MTKRFFTFVFFILLALILAVSLRGKPGNPTAQALNTPEWTAKGPFELSPDRGRFALTYSLVEDKSFHFSLPIARFATPDLGYSNGNYVSLFDSGVSFVIIPGYLLGKYFGAAQVGSFAIIAIFALINAFLVKKISETLGGNRIASNLAAIAFLFGTPAFTYGVTLYQHHLSAFLLLASTWLLLKYKGLKPLMLVWLLLAMSINIDYPNGIFAIPIGFFALARMFNFETVKSLKKRTKSLKINFKLLGILTFVTVVLPLAFFLYVNEASYGNPLQLAGTVTAIKAIDAQGKPTLPTSTGTDMPDKLLNPSTQNKSAVGFFQTRAILHGFFIQFFSPDRGTLIYAPVALFGIFGLFLLYKKNPAATGLIGAVILANILLYAMWDDPWGGWAFGQRYLIITYAYLSIGIGILLTRWRRNYLVIGVFALTLTYSILVNTLGAITSSMNPPQEEVLQLEAQSHHEEKYTFARNSVYLLQYGSKSFVYQTLLKNLLTPVQFYLGLSALIIITSLSQITMLQVSTSEREAKLPGVLKPARRKEKLYAAA